MLELLLEILGLLVCIGYFYHDYQKAKLEGMNLLWYCNIVRDINYSIYLCIYMVCVNRLKQGVIVC